MRTTCLLISKMMLKRHQISINKKDLGVKIVNAELTTEVESIPLSIMITCTSTVFPR